MISKVLFMPVNLIVTVPESVVSTGAKRKVVWLLHGACGDCETWLQSSYFYQSMENRELISVMPSALNSDYGNYPDFGTGYQFADFFFDELMPFIYSTFPVSKERDDNYIAGSSMGGYGSMALGLLHPEKFAGIAAYGSSLRNPAFLLKYANLASCDFKCMALENPRKFPTEYGPEELGIKQKEINVITKYPKVQDFIDSFECMWNRFPEVYSEGKLPRIYTACGTKDLFYQTTLDFKNKVEQMGIDDNQCHFVFASGIAHDEEFFERQFSESLRWFKL